MIDMHSHIIPNVDDGSKSLKETLEMIKEAKDVGFTSIFLTSHYLTHYYEPSVEELIKRKEKIHKALKEKDIELELYTGMEVYVSDSIRELISQNKLLELNNSRYMLIELPINANINYFDSVVYYLQSVSIIPILAHPERYTYVQKNPSLIQEYIDNGVLIQSNYGSILGLYGKSTKKVIKGMLKNNQVHFLGSDSHKPNTIYPLIPKAIKKIKKIIGEEMTEQITILNPTKIIENNEFSF